MHVPKDGEIDHAVEGEERGKQDLNTIDEELTVCPSGEASNLIGAGSPPNAAEANATEHNETADCGATPTGEASANEHNEIADGGATPTGGEADVLEPILYVATVAGPICATDAKIQPPTLEPDPDDEPLARLADTPKPVHPEEEELTITDNALRCGRATFDRVAFLGQKWAEENGMPFDIPVHLEEGATRTTAKIIWSKTWVLETSQYIITARVRCECPYHARPGRVTCQENRTVNDEFTKAHGPIEVVGFLSAFLEQSARFSDAKAHMKPSNKPSAFEIRQYLTKHGLIPDE